MFFLNFLLILLLIAINGFFVSVEFAAVTSRRSRIDLQAEKGNPSAKIIQSWLENPQARDHVIAASQIGITAVSLALGAVGENTFKALLEPYFSRINLPSTYQVIYPILEALPLVIALVIVTSLHVVFGEQVPKVASLRDPEKVALFAAGPMQVFSTIFKGFIDLLDWTTRQVLGLFGLRMIGGHSLMYTVEDLKYILDESEEGGVIEQPEREMLESIFDLGDLLVRQMMIPRTEIVAFEADTLLEEVIKSTSELTYTKFPVYEDNLDQILGILHVKDLLKSMQQGDCTHCTARSLARESTYVPETMSVTTLLQKFRTNRQHIAIVLDEYGGTAGLVTLEDLLEEIVGEVSDPFDVFTPEIQTMPDGSVLIDGLTLIEEVNDQLHLHLVDPNYDTIAGYVLGKLGRIPRPKDAVEENGVRFQVETMDGLRISSLSLTRLDSPPVA
ncbi:MAG: hemolysin family protein [Omnitrophica WOR_2 bacterium]